MKKMLKNLGLLLGIFTATGLTAQPVAYYDVTAYLGADYYYAMMKPKANWNQIFPRAYPGATLYVGTQFHENFGIELGYDWSIRQKKNWTLMNGQPFFSSTINGTFSGTARIQRSGGHVDIVGFLPVGDCTDLLGFAGVGWIQPKIEIVNLTVAPNGTMPNTSAIAAISGKGRGTFRMGAGIRYLITNIVGIRAKVGWESTSTLVVKGNAYFTQLGYTQKAFRGTTAFSAGAFVMF